MREIWKSIEGYEGIYEVSSEGRIRSLARPYAPVTRLLATRVSPASEYPRVTLCRSGHVQARYLHQLVATAFHGPRPHGLEVRHLDGNPANNRATNLRWGSRSQNMLDAVAHGTHNNARKVTCKNDHALLGNCYLTRRADGSLHRTCKSCHRAETLRRKARRKLAPIQIDFREPISA